MTDTLETTAQRIAERGRDALIERLRPAFRDAAAKHADVLELTDEQLEEMVQRAADRADGLQWHRALAGVAAEELGIDLGEALSHPAVARAQALVGAPSYEESLQAVIARRPDHGGVDRDPLPPASDPEEASDGASETVRLAVIHLGGVANLAPGERDIELRLSEFGLDIVRDNDDALGRLTWSDIRTLAVPPPRGLRRRRWENRAQLVISTDHGEASFEVPAVTPEELREHLMPVVERNGRRLETR